MSPNHPMKRICYHPLLLLNQSPKQTRFLMRKNFLPPAPESEDLLLTLNQKKNLSKTNDESETSDNDSNHNQDLFSRIAASVSNGLSDIAEGHDIIELPVRLVVL